MPDFYRTIRWGQTHLENSAISRLWWYCAFLIGRNMHLCNLFLLSGHFIEPLLPFFFFFEIMQICNISSSTHQIIFVICLSICHFWNLLIYSSPLILVFLVPGIFYLGWALSNDINFTLFWKLFSVLYHSGYFHGFLWWKCLGLQYLVYCYIPIVSPIPRNMCSTQ